MSMHMNGNSRDQLEFDLTIDRHLSEVRIA